MLLSNLRMARVTPEILDKRLANVVQGLREREFLRDTVFERRALSANIDPYSLLLGIVIGIGITVIFGLVTVEIWLPRAISRITGKALRETTTIVTEILRS